MRDVSRLRIAVMRRVGYRSAYNCPACGAAVVGFFRYGSESHWGCPQCGASPRERLINVALDAGLLELHEGARVLHVAPSERSLVARFSKIGSYTACDLMPHKYGHARAIKADLRDLGGLGIFDLIYASHVLEHIPDDRGALRSIYEHLSPDGQAWLLVPQASSPTIEGGSDLSPADRERLFGQWDHVRQYGPDFSERLQSAGFHIRTVNCHCLPPTVQSRFGLSAADNIFIARKAANGP
jgi:SAM-dependent methyltransferase